MRRYSLLFVLVFIATLVMPAGALASPPWEQDWYVDEESLPFVALAGSDAEQMWGVHDGAGYRIEVPAEWNGELIMFAHGYRGEDARLHLTNNEFPDEVRAWMLDEGYAWAMSTYKKNGYNVAQGVRDTHGLADYVSETVGEPDRVYIMGYSMGGHITAVSAEQYPVYDGAMPMCGVVGDYELFDYFLDYSATASQLALGESQFPLSDSWLANGGEVDQIEDAFEAFPGGWPFFLSEQGEEFKQLVELRSGGDRPNFDDAFWFWNSEFVSEDDPNTEVDETGIFLWDLGTGAGVLPGKLGVAVDNADAVYQLDLDPTISDAEQALNDSVVRVSHDPRTRNKQGLANVPMVSGELRVPTISIHSLGDLFVPFHNEVVYAERAEAAGASDLLVQRAIRSVLHCDFTPAEMIEGLADLTTWVETGVRPAGDVVLDPAAVAAPDYGCTFTEPNAHFLGAPCD